MRDPLRNGGVTGIYRETFDALVKMRAENGITPTLRELAVMLRVTPSAIRFRLAKLEENGWIMRLRKTARGIIVVERTGR